MRVVEYNKIIELLASHATSDPGRKLCLSLVPMTDLEDMEKAQSQTGAALAFLLRNGSISFGSNRDFGADFQALAIGTSLPAAELLRLASFLENIALVKGRAPADESDPLFDLFDCLYPLSPVAKEIRRCLPAEDIIADDASPELRRIRRALSQTDEKIHSQLNRMVNVTYASCLQDNIITIRDDRYCLPVKAEYKAQVKGIVHDSSKAGSTLFIEPASIVELGNTMRELHGQERKEEERILSSLSSLAGEQLTALRDDQANMTELDFIFAKAALALSENAMRPVLNTNHVIRIRKGRHPLIDPKKVVPIDLEIGDRYNMIVVTGPNTGGKTVTLKTIGLFTLMGMAGLHIPAGDRSELSVFREVFADIGDEQSIEQNLSTFSSHMTSIVDILRRADKDCLCLFDELGSGTDPTEGAALAISILNFLHVRGITTLATTHYAELKLFAMKTQGIVNASCEFDVETLQPTYRLLVGVPGKSNAFAIAARLGMPGYIIETAKEQMSQESKDFEELLTDLETSRQKAAKEQAEAERIRADLAKREEQLKKKEAQIEQRRREILDNANEKARNILQDAKDTADHAISQIRKGGGNIVNLEKTRTNLREKVSAKNRSMQHPAAPTPAHRQLKPSEIHIGDKVKILSMGMEGVVSTLPDKDGKLQVRCGILNSQVSLKDLALIDEETGMTLQPGSRAGKSSLKKAFRNPNAGRSTDGLDLSHAMSISPEINLIGMTTDEAVMALDKYLDDARLSHLESVRVVHGKGTGALRSAVHNYLRKQKWVKSYRSGEFGEGDAGVTIVTF